MTRDCPNRILWAVDTDFPPPNAQALVNASLEKRGHPRWLDRPLVQGMIAELEEMQDAVWACLWWEVNEFP